MGQRQEGRGGREIPRVLKGEMRRLAQAMRENGWTFVQTKESVQAFAPRWIEGGIRTVGLSKTPSDVRAWRNNRSKYRLWCDQVGVARNI